MAGFLVKAAFAAAVAAAGSSAALAGCAGLTSGAISSKFSEALASCGKAGAVAAPSLPTAVATPGTVAVPYAAPVRIVRSRSRGGDRGDDMLLRVSRNYRIDPLLLGAIVHKESAFRPGAISNKGALGLMQVMPATARSLGVSDPSRMLVDPELSLTTGASYLKHLQGKFGNDVPAVLAAYNAGPGAVKRYGRAVPYAETRDYVSTIMTRYKSARRGRTR